jgi:NADH:ubiquinone reductase (H+-translocating)
MWRRDFSAEKPEVMDDLRHSLDHAMPVLAPRPRVVIAGAGFGGLNAAKALANTNVDVTIVDRQNHHLFQPLLYQVATAGLSPNQIATPIRQILSRAKNTTVLMDDITGVDLKRSELVTCTRRIAYDFLIVATGARHTYFGHDEWNHVAPGLKRIDDAILIRRRLLAAFERAESSMDEIERRRLLTFAVVGGGPTGVEMAGAIAELARKSIVCDFRNIDSASARVMLVEAGPRILPAFHEDLSAAATKQLGSLGVEVLTGDGVTQCDAHGLTLRSNTRIEAATIVWGAGVMASPAAQWLSANADRAGRVIVGSDLTLPGYGNVFVIGDTAAVTDAATRSIPGVAPAAKQMGRHVAKHILSALSGKAYRPFTYRDDGNLATIGRKAAVAELGRIHLTGFSAWLVWSIVHVGFLIGFRNRLTVMLDWIWSYISYGRGARLITGNDMTPGA